MTKHRSPLSHHAALEGAAEILGWERCCSVADRRERTVRDWSDPDIAWEIPLPTALALDLAIIDEHPDQVPPFFAWYEAQVQIWRARGRLAMSAASERLAIAHVETGEAFAAHARAAAPGAGGAARRRARRETEEAIIALACTLGDTNG